MVYIDTTGGCISSPFRALNPMSFLGQVGLDGAHRLSGLRLSQPMDAPSAYSLLILSPSARRHSRHPSGACAPDKRVGVLRRPHAIGCGLLSCNARLFPHHTPEPMGDSGFAQPLKAKDLPVLRHIHGHGPGWRVQRGRNHRLVTFAASPRTSPAQQHALNGQHCQDETVPAQGMTFDSSSMHPAATLRGNRAKPTRAIAAPRERANHSLSVCTGFA